MNALSIRRVGGPLEVADEAAIATAPFGHAFAVCRLDTACRWQVVGRFAHSSLAYSHAAVLIRCGHAVSVRREPSQITLAICEAHLRVLWQQFRREMAEGEDFEILADLQAKIDGLMSRAQTYADEMGRDLVVCSDRAGRFSLRLGEVCDA